MSRYLLIVVAVAVLLLPLSVFAQNDDVKAGVDISIQQNQEIWAGQQVTINLDLKTTGFSFSNSHFNLPEISGAFLMQTDTTTIKLSENIEGQTWQIVRYPIALYPQRAGLLEIPAIDVRFNTSAGYGSTVTAFEFQTRPLQLAVSLPPGVGEGDQVVTTNSFKLDYDWQPETVTAHTGDAFTLTVTRRAGDISAMLLPPLPVFRTEGLAAYPQAPEVKDKTDRGDLTAERIDKIIWVAEKPGRYDIPGIRFQWWNPDSRELEQQIVPGLDLDILPSSTETADTGVTAQAVQDFSPGSRLLLLIFSGFLVVATWLRFGRRPVDLNRENEKSSFTHLQKACESNQASATHSAIHAWLTYCSPAGAGHTRTPTLGEFAQSLNDKNLAVEVENLQEALVSSNKSWQGGPLLGALKNVRRKINKHKLVQSTRQLTPLNPRSQTPGP